MYVREIHVDRFRNLKDVHLGPFNEPPEQSELIALAGPNGCGKSSILELLGKALSDAWSLNWSLQRTFSSFSFEVAIGITPEERELVLRFIAEKNRPVPADVIEYLQKHGAYYRAFGYKSGKYQERAALFNQIHNVVTESLRNYYSRPLGFFLKSERHYPQERFDRDRLFHFENVIKRDHIWSMAFTSSDAQYRDMFEYLLQLRYHYFRELGAHFHKRENQQLATNAIPPGDPLKPYDQLLQSLFPGYSFAEKDEAIPTNLFISLPSGEVVPFNDLSSGEKEVFFLLSFFLRHNVTNSVVVIDEPEMHLHPELGRMLIRTMQQVKANNQIWLATHNPEIIDEAGRDRVIYIARDRETNSSRVTYGTDEEESIRNLKDLFGYSGYVGIAKNLVFLEGNDASSDRKVFSGLFPKQGGQLKFIPSRSSANMSKLNSAILDILESNLGWMQFYLIRDRDYLPPEIASKYDSTSSGRVYVLSRHEIENYLLDEELIAKVQLDIFDQKTKAEEVNRRFRQISIRMFGEVLRDMISYRLNLVFRPQDFSLGSFLKGERVIEENGDIIPEKIVALTEKLTGKCDVIRSELVDATTPSKINAIVNDCQAELLTAIADNGRDGWRTVIPGKQLLDEYAKIAGLGKAPVLQNTLIKQFAAKPGAIPKELSELVQKILNGEDLRTMTKPTASAV